MGHSCPRRLRELPLGPSAHRAAILLTSSLLFVVGSSFLPVGAPPLFLAPLSSSSRAACRRAAAVRRGVAPGRVPTT